MLERTGKSVVIRHLKPTALGEFLKGNGMRPVHGNPHHVKSRRNWTTTILIRMILRIQRQLPLL